MSQTLKQSSVQQCTFNRVRCPGHLKVPCPWHYGWLLLSIWVHCHCHPSIFGVLISGTGTAGFLMSSGQISLSKDLFLQVSSSLDHNQHPLLLAGQSVLMPLHLYACDGGVYHCIAFLALVMVECIVWVGLSAALPKSYVCWYSFAEINRFLYNFSVGHWAANLLLAVDDYVSATSHRPHIGCQFFGCHGV